MATILVLGLTGMLGHKVCQVLHENFTVWGTIRSNLKEIDHYGILDTERIRPNVDVFDLDAVKEAILEIHPDVVVNCVGVIKRSDLALDPVTTITVNALFPHKLAGICRKSGVRMIHISTDCVFSGKMGSYTEKDVSDAEDLYGRSKFLGEVGDGCLTLRTSIIGRELNSKNGLLEWFLDNRGRVVKGFSRAIFSGFTSIALSRIIGNIVDQSPDLSGVYHVSAEPINKYNLLCMIREVFSVEIDIEPFDDMKIDRSLDSSLFRSRTDFAPPSWLEMIQEMKTDATPYDRWR